MANNGHSVSESKQSGRAALVPIPLPNSQSGEALPLLSPVPSLISDSSFSSNLLFFFAGARQRPQTSAGLSIYIDETRGSLSFFFSGDKREAGSNEDFLEASEGSGYGSDSGVLPEGSGSC